MPIKQRLIIAVTVLSFVAVTGFVVGCDSDDGPKVTPPSGGGGTRLRSLAFPSQKATHCVTQGKTPNGYRVLRNNCETDIVIVTAPLSLADGMFFESIESSRNLANGIPIDEVEPAYVGFTRIQSKSSPLSVRDNGQGYQACYRHNDYPDGLIAYAPVFSTTDINGPWYCLIRNPGTRRYTPAP